MKTTAQNYSRRVSSLMAFLLRDRRDYELQIPQELSKLLAKVEKHLTGGISNSLCNALHRVLFCLWTTEWAPAIKSEIHDPTICYLALMSIQEDGTFTDQLGITNPIAAFEFCMRCSFLIEMHQNADPKNKTNDLNRQCDLLSHWFTEKHESTFNSLRSLQHRATVFIY
jgi:hypothetical protein